MSRQDDEEVSLTDLFDIFYKQYPRHKDRAYALKCWLSKVERKDFPQILEAVRWQKNSDDWLKDGGQFIPYPSSYINGRRWEDERRRSTIEKLRSPETIDENYTAFICLEFGAKLFATSPADLLQWFKNNERAISTIKTACPDMDLGLMVLRYSKKEHESKGFPWIPDRVAKNFAFIMQEFESKHYKRSNR